LNSFNIKYSKSKAVVNQLCVICQPPITTHYLKLYRYAQFDDAF